MVKSLAFAVACLVFVNMAPSTFGNACGDREIRIGFMGPYNSPISPGDSVSVLPVGFLAAVKWLNTDISNIFPIQNCTSAPNVTVVPFMLDSSRIGNNSKTRAVRHADQLYKCSDAGGDATSDAGGDAASCSAEASIGHNVDAVIADQYSSTATTIAMMAEIHGKPMIGYGSTSDELSNKHDFPYYNRVVAPDRYQAPFLAAMAHGFGWRHIGILNGHGSYAVGFAGAFAAKCATFTDPILIEERHVFTEGSNNRAKMDAMLSTINKVGVKIIMLASAGYADTVFVLERAHALGMTGDGYIWIGADGWLSANDFKDIDGQTNRLKEYTHGSVGIFHYTDLQSPAAITATNAMYGAGSVSGWQALASERAPSWDIPEYTSPYDAWGYYVWDATVHTVRALAMANASCFMEGSCTQEAIRSQDSYMGATGRVELDEHGDRAVGRYVILNVNQASSDILVPVGTIEGDAQGEPVVTITDAQWDSIVWPNGAKGRSGIPNDGDWSTSSKTEIDTDLAIGLGLGFGIPILLLLGFLYFYRKQKIKRSREKQATIAATVYEKDALQKQLTDLQESMASTMEVRTPWAGIGAKAEAINSRRKTSTAALAMPPRTTSQIKETVQETYYRWYWEEDANCMHKHNKFMVKAPCWVEYAGSVATELETNYQNFESHDRAMSYGVHKTDLADRISTTGNEQKANNAHTGTKYTINFFDMTQRNDQSGFSRKMLRDKLQRSVTKYRDEVNAEEVTGDDVVINIATTNAFSSETVTSFLEDEAADEIPLNFDIEDTLPLHLGQLIQVHKKRRDGYWHGSIIYDQNDADNDHAGWFPGVNLTKASAKLTAAFQAKIGGAGADALAVPTSWDDQPDKLHAQAFDVPLGSTEAKGKIAEFLYTLGAAPPKIISLRRVQNVPMWQSYAVKKITMMNRVGAHSDWEKPTLFHGTDEDTAKKIMQQGFNRNFSGLNATFYGKGVYFARDASYSSSKTYARPNDAGVQCMFICRVLAGEYCVGKKDVKAPDVLDAATNRLYDTTVDNVSSPAIFVTYHDAQVYPEYLIQFKQ